MEAIVLAGGLGTRLRDVVPDMPKPMATIVGRPFLEILLSMLSQKGFGRVILSLGYMADKVVSHFGDRYAGMELVYEIENVPLGTGGALRQALTHCRMDHAFVFNGDTYLDLEVSEAESQWRANHAPIIIGREMPDTFRYGRLNTSGGRVIGFLEKGMTGPGLINAGCYIFPVSILDDFPLGKPFSLETDFLEKAVLPRRFDLFVTHGHFIDIGVPDDYMRAQIELA